MRRALITFLILSLLGGQVGMLGALLSRHLARQQMHRQIDVASELGSDRAEIQHLTISQSELRSSGSSFVQIDQREFRYQGNLYDIVREEWRGSDWHVWVLHDWEEEQHLDALAQAMNTPTLEGSTVPVQQRPALYLPLALVPAEWASSPSPQLSARSFPRVSSTPPQSPHLEVPDPPPWG